MKSDYNNVLFPPWKIKLVEPLPAVSRSFRKRAIKKAGYNTFLLRSEDVLIDLLTDSGTNAMYDSQRSAMELADEAYAGSRSFFRLEETVKKLYGFPYMLPTHQGRAAEHLVSKVLIKPGDHVLSNMYFTTSRAHAEAQGALWDDVSISEAHDPQSMHPFKGNVDTEKLKRLIQKFGRKKIAFVRIEASLNMAGGQPFSMENLQEVKKITQSAKIPLLIDGTRAIENCYFVKTREKGYQNRSIKEILYEMCRGADWLVVSAKKDAIVNMGGFLCMRNPDDFEKTKNLLVLYEGFIHYGGLAGRDMEAIATGLKAAVDERYIAHRITQVQYLGELLLQKGIPIVVPIGGHAVYLDAKRFLPHIPQHQFPAQALAAAIYVECGVRSMERGLASAGRNPATRQQHHSPLELVRLTIPRLTYTESHLNYAAEGIAETFRNRKHIKGLRIVYEPAFLRFFQARFDVIQ